MSDFNNFFNFFFFILSNPEKKKYITFFYGQKGIGHRLGGKIEWLRDKHFA